MKALFKTVAVGTILAMAASASAQEGVRQTERLVKSVSALEAQ